jgi:branched-chain amino acid aminotransferase
LVSTTRDVQPVHDIDGRVLVAPGAATQQVQQVWSAREADGIDP